LFLSGATIGYFPVDLKSLEYLRQTNRDEDKIQLIQAYLTAVGMLRLRQFLTFCNLYQI
jgi:aconitate hydratase